MDASRAGAPPPAGTSRFGAAPHLVPAPAPGIYPYPLFAAAAYPLAADFRSIRAVGGAEAPSLRRVPGLLRRRAAHHFASGAAAADRTLFAAPGYSCDASAQHELGTLFAPPGAQHRTGSGPGAAAAERTLSAAHAGDPRSSTSDLPAVQRVWRHNSALEFKRVLDKLSQPRRRLFIALDLEYVADASTDVHYKPISNVDWYQHLREYVNRGDVLQLGLVLAFEQADTSMAVMALEINFHLDVQSRSYNPHTINFLQKQGHCLDDHRDRGVIAECVFAGLLRHLPFGDNSVTWIAYHGDRDIGFILRLLHAGGRGMLPPDRATFLHQVREKFPVFYDVRVLGQIVIEGFVGKLTKLADDLGIHRIGEAHFAGSDAILTLACFWNIMHNSVQKLAARLSLLSGVEEFDMAIKCSRCVDDCSTITVDVREQNFEDEARRINELIASNFRIIGLKVLLPKLTSQQSTATDPQQEYSFMKRRLSGVDMFQVLISFMNAEGMVAYGRIWKYHFSINCAGTNGYADPRRFAQLLASSGVSHNTEVTWVTCDGAHGLGCLMKSFMMPLELPDDLDSYSCHCGASFPVIYDIRFIGSQCPVIGQLLTGCNGEPGVQRLLQCYMKLSERQDFLAVSSVAQGKLVVV
ncbi:unnamed protein product [Urochloa decumbens]|uniref:Uncharacterized protein n=1 Tax=Urochloa decumbens TaxID=240449 RepID=A0ABC9BHY6_9POAL